jgi:hypothetical protein
LDLFRYSGVGVRSFNTTLNNGAFLSIDGGTTSLTQFNTDGSGDYQDFQGGNQVQNAFATAGTQPNLGTAELTGLDVIGYTVVPEPSTFFLVTLSFGLFLFRYHRRISLFS